MLAPEMRPVRLWLLAAVPLLQPVSGFAGDLSFSGSLVRVGRESISVKLADRRVIDARLPNARSLAAGKIAVQYAMGDQVQVTCKSIRQVWEESTSRYQYLEVTALRLVRRLPPAELDQMLAFPPFREGENLLVRSNAAEAAPGLNTRRATVAGGLDAPAERKLEHAREVNLEYASTMPNFVADETAKRYTSDNKSEEWRYLDTVETEIAFTGNRVVRQQIRRNGKPWDRPFEALPGFKWYGASAPKSDLSSTRSVPPRLRMKGGRKCVAGKCWNTGLVRRRMDASDHSISSTSVTTPSEPVTPSLKTRGAT